MFCEFCLYKIFLYKHESTYHDLLKSSFSISSASGDDSAAGIRYFTEREGKTEYYKIEEMWKYKFWNLLILKSQLYASYNWKNFV